MLARLMLAAAALGLGLGVAEIGARALGYSPLHDVYSRPSLLWRHDPLLGWSHTPGARDVYVGPRPFPIEFRTEISINARGLRGPEIGPKEDGGLRILVLGDSVVAAFEVEERDTMPAVLERRLARRVDVPVEVINAGVRGYGTDQSYLWFRDRAADLEPDIVVFSHSANDPVNDVTLHRIRRLFGKSAFRSDLGGHLTEVATPIPEYPLCSEWVLDDALEVARIDTASRRLACLVQTRLSDHSALFSLAAMRLAQLPSVMQFLNRLVIGGDAGGGARAAQVIPLPIAGPSVEMASAATRMRHTLRLVAALQALVIERGAAFVFLMSPPQQRKLDPDWPELRGLDPIGLLGGRYVPPEAVRFVNDAHYTAVGHDLWAERLTPVLLDVIAEQRPDVRIRRR